MSSQAAVAELNSATASTGILFKLVLFSVLLGVLPISSYFASLKYVWDGNATYAAITAIVAANAVLVGYIIVSILEDKSSTAKPKHAAEKETKKQQ